MSVAALTTMRADLIAVAVGLEHDGDAERRPVVGRAGGDLEVGGASCGPAPARAPRRSARSSPARSRSSRRTDPRPRACARPSGRSTVSVAPSAISTGGRSMCGSPCASAPPTVATLRTRTFESVSSVRAITGACLRTSAERSSAPTASSSRRCAARRRSPRCREYLLSILRRLTSLSGRNTPAFIISISAVPPAIGRMVGSSGSSSLIASASEVGSASSNGIISSSRLGRRELPRAAAAANIFSMSLALERSTGWPMLPSLPASVRSTE